METTTYGQSRRLFPLHTSSSSSSTEPNARDDSGLAMRYPILRTISSSKITVYRQFNRPRLFCVENTEPKRRMADKANDNSRLGGESKKQEAEKLPPPPEKPYPGDCCGSGCVRCVWDVYYEELEDYNKLVSEIKSKSDSGSQ